MSTIRNLRGEAPRWLMAIAGGFIAILLVVTKACDDMIGW